MDDYEDQELTDYEKQLAKELVKDVRRAIARAEHHLDQLSALCRDENRAPTAEEWAKLEELLG